jgi:hypothetical protein
MVAFYRLDNLTIAQEKTEPIEVKPCIKRHAGGWLFLPNR